MSDKDKSEYYNGVHWSELPEYKELGASLDALDAFQKVHEVEYCTHLLPEERWILNHKPFSLICGEHKDVLRENLTPEENAEYDAIFERMRVANIAYLKIVRPDLVKDK